MSHWSRARWPICTRSPRSSRSTATAVCASPQLIEAILERQGGDSGKQPAADGEEPRAGERPSSDGAADGAASRRGAKRRPRSSPRARSRASPSCRPGNGDRGQPERQPDETVEGVVELLPNGSGFVRVDPPEPSDDDVYISSAQVRRCELVSGDRVTGPRRAPRRSERFAALVRIDTVNGRPAAELADSARYDDLPASFPSERFELATGRRPDGAGDRGGDADRTRLARDDRRARAVGQDRAAAAPGRCARRTRRPAGVGGARRRSPRGACRVARGSGRTGRGAQLRAPRRTRSRRRSREPSSRHAGSRRAAPTRWC